MEECTRPFRVEFDSSAQTYPNQMSIKKRFYMETFPYLCHAAKSLLLVVDIQPRLADAMSEEEREQMLDNAGMLIQAANVLAIPILLTEQYPKGLGETHAAILEHLPDNTQRFEKTGFSCCAAGGFNEALESASRQQVILVGQEAHVCILQSALELHHRGFQVFVVEDAICSRKPNHKIYALERMRRAGITITNGESVLFEWLRDAAHPQFKELAKLIR